jgi:hypothetical protein
MKKSSKWQLEDIPLQINIAPVHSRVKAPRKLPNRSKSASRETMKETGTCISPRSQKNDFLNYDLLQKENFKLYLDKESIIEMPSHLEESPRKETHEYFFTTNLPKILECTQNLIQNTPGGNKKLRRIVTTDCSKKILKPRPKTVYLKTQKCKKSSLRIIKLLRSK